MGLIIECPYYISDKRRTISCEGCIRHFTDVEEKKGQLVNVCEKNYKKCKYYSGLQKIYESCNDSSLETKLRLKDYYLEENRKTIKKLIQRIGIMETNIAHNIETKQREVDKLQQLANGAVYDEDHQTHEVHSCKIETFLELIESLQGKPVLVFYSFQHDKARILAALASQKHLRVRELKTTQDQADWNARKIDVLLAHPASAAYGLNLQAGGNHVVWFGLTWNYEQYSQANKRLHRQGQTEKVIIHHLITKDTRDEDVMEALQHKDDVQNWVMESLKARIKKIREENQK